MSRWPARLLLALALLLAAAAPAAAQRGIEPAPERPEPPRLLTSAWAGFSVREGQTTLRFADDLISWGVRVALNRARAVARPWIQGDYFVRPDLDCVPGLPCKEEGALLRAGFTLPVTEDESRPGVHPRLLAGIGVGIADEAELAYLLGIGAAWTLHPRLAPVFEARWERVPGLRNVAVLGFGLTVGLF